MAYSIRYDDETGAPIGVTIDPRDCSDRAWWALSDFCVNIDVDIHRDCLPPPGYSRAADAMRHADAQARRVAARRADSLEGVSLNDADAAVVRVYRRSYKHGRDDAVARDAAVDADPRNRSRDRINAVLRAAGIRARNRR